jgi:hypothetical protein
LRLAFDCQIPRMRGQGIPADELRKFNHLVCEATAR